MEGPECQAPCDATTDGLSPWKRNPVQVSTSCPVKGQSYTLAPVAGTVDTEVWVQGVLVGSRGLGRGRAGQRGTGHWAAVTEAAAHPRGSGVGLGSALPEIDWPENFQPWPVIRCHCPLDCCHLRRGGSLCQDQFLQMSQA